MRASRPAFAQAGSSGELLEWSWVLLLLSNTRNAWLATVSADGSPHVAPLWLVVDDGAIWFWTLATTTKGRNLARDGRLSLHVEAGDEVAIVQGTAENVPPPPSVRAAYVAKYGSSGLDEDAFWRLSVTGALAWRGHLGAQQLDTTRFS